MDKKERKRIYNKEYQQKNKEQLKEYREKDKEERKIYNKEYHEKNKEKNKEHKNEYQKEYREKNKEKIKEQQREKYQQNKEKINEQKKIYNQSPNGIKFATINRWKYRGLICDDWDALYDKYLETTHCELCSIEFSLDKKRSKSTKCLDHDHSTGSFRNFICHSCNVTLPRQ